MRVAVSVVNHGLLLNALFGDGQVNVNAAVVGWRGGKDGDFQRVQRLARIAVGDFRQVSHRGFVRLNFQMAEAAPGIGERPPEQFVKFAFVQRVQLKNLGTGDQR